MIDAFQNDHQSMQVGQLVIENQTDKITIYGDIDIYRTEEGLAQAKQLQQLFNNIVQVLSVAPEADNQKTSISEDVDSLDNDNIKMKMKADNTGNSVGSNVGNDITTADKTIQNAPSEASTVKVVKNPFAK